jgi:hypothetical protein
MIMDNKFYYKAGKKIWYTKPNVPFQISYKYASDKERNKITKYFLSKYPDVKDINFTLSDSYDSHEVTFTLSGRSYLLEAKCRKLLPNDFDSAIIEQTKYNYLTAVTYNTTVIPVYLFFYSDNSYRAWNLNNISLLENETWENRILPVSGVDLSLGYVEKKANYLWNHKTKLIFNDQC